MTFAALAAGLILALGIIHRVGVLTTMRITPHASRHGHRAVLMASVGLLFCHRSRSSP